MKINKRKFITKSAAFFIIFSLTLYPCLISEILISVSALSIGIYRIFTAIPVYLIAIMLFSRLGTARKKIFYLYFVTVIYLFLLEAYLYYGTGNSTIGQINRLLLGISYLFILKSNKIDIKIFTIIFVNLSFVICVYSLLSHFNVIPDLIEVVTITRNQGIFSEPSRFAQFLQFPMLFSVIRFYKKRSLVNFIVAVVIVASFVTTFSVANFFSVLLSLIIFYTVIYVRKKYLYRKRNLFLRYFVAILMVFIFTFITIKFYNISNSLNYDEKLIGRNISHIFITTRVERFEVATSMLDKNIFGYRHLGLIYHENPGAIGTHIIQGGYILVFLVFAYTFVFFKHIFKHLPYSPNPILYMSLLAFFIAFNWYGDYTEVYYLFLIALTLRFIDEEKSNKKSIVS